MLKLKLSSIEEATATSTSFSLLSGKKYVVGRRHVDGGLTITFPGDPSIAQQLTELEVLHEHLDVPLLKPMLLIKEIPSDSGIFIRTEQFTWRLIKRQIKLRIGDRFSFKPYQNAFTIDYTPFVVLPSSFSLTSELESMVEKLGGHCVNEWSSSVTHLVMEEVKLSLKAVCALLAGKPIVSPAFFSALLSAYDEGNNQLPDPNHFLPPVAIINNGSASRVNETAFFPNPNRSTLFEGKTFLFGNKQRLEIMKPVVLEGGGCAKLIAEVREEDILLGNHIIIDYPKSIEDAMNDPISRQIIECYKSGNKRFLTNKQIGLAVIFCSTEYFCDPEVGGDIAANPALNGEIANNFDVYDLCDDLVARLCGC
ncbi:Nibrin [Orchesella cincta]|uniref:Nibrin n=1 Tax=Orchesella cincta TaxID=48709 RepID=A0A1D2MQ42_ORCCI|nr:Nibrin [Orchesella cincta]